MGGFLNAQDTIIKGIEKDELEDCQIVRNEVFKGTSLWGLINGGADVYLEYGFSALLLQEIKRGNTNFRIEIYKMKNPLAAYGIYQMSCFKCKEKNNIFRLNCLNPYQFQTVVGDSYISIINDTGNIEDQQFSSLIAKNIVSKHEDSKPVFPGIFDNDVFGPYMENLKVFKGPLGLQNGYSQFSEKFEDYSDYKYYLLPFAENLVLSNIIFKNKEATDLFLLNNYPGIGDKNIDRIESVDGTVSVCARNDSVSVVIFDYDNNNSGLIKKVNSIISKGKY